MTGTDYSDGLRAAYEAGDMQQLAHIVDTMRGQGANYRDVINAFAGFGIDMADADEILQEIG